MKTSGRIKTFTDIIFSSAISAFKKPYKKTIVKKILEKDIQREIVEWLNKAGYFFWRQNNIPVFDKGNFRRMPKYSSKGSPDIMILYKGKFVGLEVKTPHYWKYTDDQIRFRDLIEGNGGFYYVVTSLVEAQSALDKI